MRTGVLILITGGSLSAISPVLSVESLLSELPSVLGEAPFWSVACVDDEEKRLMNKSIETVLRPPSLPSVPRRRIGHGVPFKRRIFLDSSRGYIVARKINHVT
jgi:hypothetical protein